MSQPQNMNATGGGVNASQTVSLNSKCQNLILMSANLPMVRENVLIPILDFLAHDLDPPLTLKSDPIKVLWHLFRQGAFMCELLNQVQPGVIQSIALPISPIGVNNFSDANSRQNVAAFVKASRDMFFLTDDQLFNPGDMYKEDLNAFSKAIGLCEMYLNNKLRVSSRSSVSTESAKFDDDIQHLFELKASKDTVIDDKTRNSTESNVVKVSKRARIFEEMIASERVYVEDLARLNKYKEMIKFERLLPQKTIDLIFANLKELLNFQRKFMIEMENQIQKDRPDFSYLFQVHESDFVLYEEFCLNHSTSLKALKENKKILESRMDLLDCVGDVEGYMIKPIQRVTRYSLFLRDIVKEAQKIDDLEEAKNAERAADSVKRIANRINERQRTAENEDISTAFFSHFAPKVISPDKTGKLVLSDKSMKLKLDGEMKVYQVFLFQKKLIMCSEKEVYGPFWVKNRISMNSITEVRDVASNETSVPFEAEVTCTISENTVNFSLLFRTQQAQRMWINSMRSLAELPALDYTTHAPEVILDTVAEAVKEETVQEYVQQIEVIQHVPHLTRIRVAFRGEYYSFMLKCNYDLTLMSLNGLVLEEIENSAKLEYRKIDDLPPVDRIRLRFKDGDGVVVKLSNDQVVCELIKERAGGVLDLIVYEGDPIRIRVSYRDIMYSFTVDDLSAIEELKLYIYETVAEDFRMINANVEAIPKGDMMRLFFKENDGEWSLMLYDNDLEINLKECNRRLDLKF